LADPVVPELSVVITCHFEERSIDEFHARLSRTLEGLGRSYEIVMVNDGSTDGTLAHLHAIFERDPRVTAVVDLMRNAGQAAAITAGCRQARGQAFVFMDSDLQLDPEDLPRLLAEYDRGGDAVCGYRVDRVDSLGRKIGSRLANVAMRRVSRSALHDLGCTFKVVDGRIVRAFEAGPFRSLRAPALVAAARDVVEVPVAHHQRPYERSGYSPARLIAFAIENVVAMSERPFQFLSLACLVASALLVLRLVSTIFFPRTLLAQVTNGLILHAVAFSLLVVVAVLSAVGEYVIRSYLILRGDPVYVIRSVRRRDGAVET
jgi:undecaprenyl-phosphate 4-deoxy-4-formamido-L-arabinose transferase